MSNLVMYALIASILILAIVLTANLIHRINVRKRVEAERRDREAKESRRKALAQRQGELGDRLLGQLIIASKKNTVVNIVNDNIMSCYGLIEVGRIADNGGKYSIIPKMLTTKRFNRSFYEICQINICMKDLGREIHVSQPYGPETSYSVDQFEMAMQGLIEYIENYRFFPLQGSPKHDEVFDPRIKR